MKKLSCFIFSFFLLFSLAGCLKQSAGETDMELEDIMAAILQSQQELPELTQITWEDTDFNIWLSDYYLLQAENVMDGVVCYADGVEASEIAVLLMKEEEDCSLAREALGEYIQNRAGVFEGYAPKQAEMAKNGITAKNGRYIVMLICGEPQAAKAAFLDCFDRGAESVRKNTGNGDDTGEELGMGEGNGAGNEYIEDAGENAASMPSQETEAEEDLSRTENSYNEEAVLAAYQSGDDSSLSEINRSILEAAEDAIESEIEDGMSDYEKELAMHDYITERSRFDYGVFGRNAADALTNGSDTPYGVLIDGSAMCHGYSSTFQLFMDMLGIECITVYGIPGSSGLEHSWNMVKLDGEWYHVDCAWDDPIGGSPCHTYFNVTSAYLLRGSIHRWDEASYPEATATAYTYRSQ